MPGLRLDELVIHVRREPAWRVRVWREWCFMRAVAARFGVRALIIGLILVTGGLLFMRLEPEREHSLPKAMFLTWALVFGEAPEEFPTAPVLQALFFIVPILGLTIIIEGLIEFSLMVRDRQRMERNWCLMMTEGMKNHVILVGLGRLGFRTFRLLRKLGVPVVVLERRSDNQFLDDVRRDGSPLLIGDARREAMLEDANVARARAVILATTDDLANLEIALDARRLAPGIRVVLRMFDQNMADKVCDAFSIRMAASQAAICAPAFAIGAIDADIVSSFVVGDRLAVMKRWSVDGQRGLAGRTIGDVMREHGVCVVEHTQSGAAPAIFPSPDVVLRPGDSLLVQGTYEKLVEPTPVETEAVRA